MLVNNDLPTIYVQVKQTILIGNQGVLHDLLQALDQIQLALDQQRILVQYQNQIVLLTLQVQDPHQNQAELHQRILAQKKTILIHVRETMEVPHDHPIPVTSRHQQKDQLAHGLETVEALPDQPHLDLETLAQQRVHPIQHLHEEHHPPRGLRGLHLEVRLEAEALPIVADLHVAEDDKKYWFPNL